MLSSAEASITSIVFELHASTDCVYNRPGLRHRRYEREVNQGQRSILSRIFEKDTPPSGAMVLTVAALRPPACADGTPTLVRTLLEQQDRKEHML